MSDVNEAQRRRMNAELREYIHCKANCSCRALEASVQAPAVDTGKAAKAIWEVLWPGTSDVMDDAELGLERAQVQRILFALTGSGILQDAAEVERAGKELGYNHGATDMQAETNGAGYAMNPYRAHPVREGNVT